MKVIGRLLSLIVTARGAPERSAAVVPGELTVYRVPLVANARHFDVSHRLRVVVASDEQLYASVARRETG